MKNLTELQESETRYRTVRSSTVTWGAVYVSLALILALVTAIASDEYIRNIALVLASIIAGISLVIIGFTTWRLKSVVNAEEKAESEATV